MKENEFFHACILSLAPKPKCIILCIIKLLNYPTLRLQNAKEKKILNIVVYNGVTHDPQNPSVVE